MSSASAMYGTPDFASYGATKFAVKGFTEAMNIEWARHRIKVMDILPLFVDTAMVRNFEMHPKSMDTLGMGLVADDVARTVWRAAHWRLWPRAHWYPSAQGWFLALANKLMPAWFTRLTTKMVSGY
jgi:NAD(P)-dependent dehydrogenase (short-subunit alcohol dehydrogenase family)